METDEWSMIVDLYKIHDELPPDAEDFILNLYEHIDPHAPFYPQLIGLPESMERQMAWIFKLHKAFIDLDPEGAQEIWEDYEDGL